MKKYAAIILALIMVLSLSGCGNGHKTQVEIQQDPNNGIEQPDVIHVPSLQKIINDVHSYADTDNMQWDDTVDDFIKGYYENGDYDPYDIYIRLCDYGVFHQTPQSGILMVSKKTGDQYTVTTGSFKATYYTFTVNIDFIDPETGNITHYKTFSTEQTHSCSAELVCINNTAEMRKCFSKDMTKMAATVIKEDGYHVGWIDESGEFSDVTERITVKSDFGGIIEQGYPCFWEDYFYFSDSGGKKRVPVDNISPNTVETMASSNYFGVHILPDGTVKDTISAFTIYYDDSLSYAANSNFFGDWISQTQHVGTDDGMIYKFEAIDTDDGGQFRETEAIVPRIKDRVNRNPVISPDGNRVAFLSRLETGGDIAEHLFIVPLDGGEPVKVNTSYSFTSDFSIVSNYHASILDWMDGSDIKISTSNQVTSDNQGLNANTTPTQPEKVYKAVKKYTIDGKWKNVGTTTYGQVQSGAIIVFDGSSCNVVSPFDTYGFYKDGDNFRLDCTTPLADTISFTVKIVDDNNIDVYYNSKDYLELTRVD